MRLVEKCGCGASIELAWSEPDGYHHRAEKLRESERAAKEVATFRKNHKACRDSNTGTERPE